MGASGTAIQISSACRCRGRSLWSGRCGRPRRRDRRTAWPPSGRDRCRQTRQYECPREAPSCFNLLRVCSLQTAKRVTLMRMALLKRFHYRPEVVATLGKLMRSTAFRLTLVYLLIFIVFAVSLLGYFALNTRRLITEQITTTINTEISGLSEQYTQGGIRRLVIVVDLRPRRPGSSLYLVTTATGEGLAGNVGSLEPGVLDHPGWLETNYRRLEAPEGSDHRALVQVVQLPGGFRLLVGRDLEERERLFGIIANAGQWSLALVIVLGLAGGFFVSR